MAKLTRATQKVFAGSANNNGVFGSLQAGTKQLSNDIETIQSLPAYEQGWNSATVSSELLPPLEEFQGLQYVNSYQQAYTFQEGIPEWDSGTTYYSGSTCKVISGSDFILYKSLIDNNINNIPSSSPSQWAEIFNTANGVQSLSNLSQTLDDSTENYPSNKAVKDAVGNISFPVGSLIPFAGNVTPSGWFRCDGSAVSRTMFADLFAVIGTMYGAGDGSTTFNLPNFINRTFWGGATSGAYLSGTLPNITGGFGGIDDFGGNPNGAFRLGNSESGASGGGTDYWCTFDASRCSSKYQNGALVRPESVQTMILIKY